MLNRLRDGLGHKISGIANRFTFELRLDERDLRNPSEGTASYLATQTTSSTSLQCRRSGWADGGRIRVLIWGNSTRLEFRAFSSGAVIKSSAHPISSVCRFGRDSRHPMNGGKEDPFHERCTVMNLQRTRRVSSDPGTKKGTNVLHASGQKRIDA